VSTNYGSAQIVITQQDLQDPTLYKLNQILNQVLLGPLSQLYAPGQQTTLGATITAPNVLASAQSMPPTNGNTLITLATAQALFGARTTRTALATGTAPSITENVQPVVSGISSVQFVSSNPSGSCTIGSPLQYNNINGTLWGCDNGTWTEISGGTGGSVTISDTTLSANTTITGPNPSAVGQILAVFIRQNATGGFATTWNNPPFRGVGSGASGILGLGVLALTWSLIVWISETDPADSTLKWWLACITTNQS
jgi:hypothetical protein